QFARDLDDLVGEREQVLRLTEERVRRRQHLVKPEPLVKLAEAEWHVCADDVYLVTPRGQCLAELGGHDSAAAYRRVADDADVHGWRSRMRCGRTTGVFTTKPSANATPAWAPNWASRLS